MVLMLRCNDAHNEAVTVRRRHKLDTQHFASVRSLKIKSEKAKRSKKIFESILLQ